MVDLNASAAARRAGYSARTADAIGRENLGKPTVSAAIAAARLKLSERAARTVADVMADIGKVRSDAMRTDPESGAMLSHKDALKALELEGKHLGAFVERVEHSGAGGAALSLAVSFLEPPKTKGPHADDA